MAGSSNIHRHQFTYDPAGRLRQIDIYDGSGTLSKTINYDYDGDGNRVKEKVGNETRYFLYSGSRKVLELDGTKTVTAYYVHGADGIVYRRKVSGEYEYHHKDWLGGTTLITDDSQNVVASYFYDVFGAPRWSLASVTDNAHLFTGKEFDESSNLYYFVWRYYDPYIGRFISRDPAFDGINWYVYVQNNPLVFIDPTGMYSIRDAWNSVKSAAETAGDFVADNSVAIAAIAGGTAQMVAGALIAGGGSLGGGAITVGSGGTAAVAGVPVAAASIVAGTTLILTGAATTGAGLALLKNNMDDQGGGRAGQKGKSFRGGKQSSRDQWYGFNDKRFQRWWHRVGKDELGGRKDMPSRETVKEAFEYWEAIGKPTVK